MEALLEHLPLIEEKIKYRFENRDHLLLAFIHSSFQNEHRDSTVSHNERLEFLGDSVLGLIVSDFLYQNLPDRPEGELSQLRSHIVGGASCFAFLQKLSIGQYILLGKGERYGDGRGRDTIAADLFEALIGAIYVDGGLEAARQFFLFHFAKEVEMALKEPLRNWKAELQDYSQKKFQKPPSYVVLKEAGPDHKKIFHVAVFLGDEECGQGDGPSKKQAEQTAAAAALKKVAQWPNKS